MSSQEILDKYLNYFIEKGHKKIPNVSLVPENDPTLLFVNSGMFPLVPYLLGEKHPLGNKLVNVQRCVRFEDMENVGTTNRHTIAFHMIGNWSLNDYFKKEQLEWKYDFYINHLKLDVNKIYATVFSGSDAAPKDTKAVELLKDIFKKYGIDAEEGVRIFETPKDNWWQRGDAVGELGGPSSEIFYYIGDQGNGEGLNLLENEDDFIEIGNSVFMQYKMTENGWEPIEQNNIDFGGGLERIALCVQNKQDIFETDNFYPVIQKIEELTGKKYNSDEKTTYAMRVLADHMRTSTFLAMDGVTPSNKDQGYMLRRVLRRMVREARNLGIEGGLSTDLVPVIVDNFSWLYPQLNDMQNKIIKIFDDEETKFGKTLAKGARESAKALEKSDGDAATLAETAYNLYQSVGYPVEIFLEDVKDAGLDINIDEVETAYENYIKEHKEQSRKGAEQKFKGGLADQSEQTVKYHTATHLLHWGLRQVLGEHVSQQGSNITGERLRFDFAHEKKLTPEEISMVEDLINEKINESLPVQFEIMPKQKAEASGALHFFGDKYGDEVKVYYIGDNLESAFSKEFCGGPHVENTNEIGNIQIYKQDKIGEGKIRVYLK